MVVNKNALLRYRTLDRCFRNAGRKYRFEDLKSEVNEAIFEWDPAASGIEVRQLREDIRFMRSKSGYDAPIKYYRDTESGYYRYENRKFSIDNSPLNSTEAEQLNNALQVLQRFEGTPHFEWIQEITPLLKDRFGLKGNETQIMAFETNIDYKGYEFITPVFNAIVNRRVLKISYQPFVEPEFVFIFHPYFLKQFNNRWFVFGLHEEYQVETWNVPLDRVNSVEEVGGEYQKSKIDWEDYFYDIIGVTKKSQDLEKIVLLFNSEQAPYIQTKPIHPTQKAKFTEEGDLSIEIHVVPNYELETQILSFGEKVRVVTPHYLRKKILGRLTESLNSYMDS